jgi:hypothetical protein
LRFGGSAFPLRVFRGYRRRTYQDGEARMSGDVRIWGLLLVMLGIGSGVAWAWFYSSVGKRGDRLRKEDPMAAGVHDTAFMQMANPAALPMRDHAFDKPKH